MVQLSAEQEARARAVAEAGERARAAALRGDVDGPSAAHGQPPALAAPGRTQHIGAMLVNPVTHMAATGVSSTRHSTPTSVLK